MIKIISVVGARPNFMKVAPLHRAFVKSGIIESIICHTGQHYDAKMSQVFFDQLQLPKPHIYLGIEGGSHAVQTARVMIAFEKVLEEHRPDIVVVVGDVNSTVACSLTAKKLHFPVVHVEAGLRSFDNRMPEEINRIVTDAISDHLFVTEQSGLDNLKKEGVPAEKMHLVGNVMIDSLVHFKDSASKETTREELGFTPQSYLVSTLHRPSNVDNKESLRNLIDILQGLAATYPVILPLHPRTRNNLSKFGLMDELGSISNLHLTEPLGYLQFMNLIMDAKAVVTDSGGIQEETTFLGVPCITLRENTERPSTLTEGTNQLVKIERTAVLEALKKGLKADAKIPWLWDGKTAQRITDILIQVYDK